ncbi:hypothetical protein [Legionella cherrii]|uniref:Uncharacterized protein n=1 Tax=Legionella cherrii TaxID=28084 RepID=A0A0W0S869_9GAMM|nr:hypothetical protein [Legionella cherrii]KTC79109.1 hypothetical protein Lche_1129 [Legionella cherrii]VEB36568.1 Uncharacterised protein [Legionella cherrii]
MRRLSFLTGNYSSSAHQYKQGFSSTVLNFIKTKNSSVLDDFRKIYKINSETSTFQNFVLHLEKNNKGRSSLYRGMSISEVTDILRKEKFVCPHSSKKDSHYNIPEHVIRNNSAIFGSFSPSLVTGGKYASSTTIVPSTGAITETNFPPFFINPKELVATHEELYERYSKRYESEEREQAGEFQGLTNVLDTAATNSEITMIRNFGKTYVGLQMQDVRAIHILTVPGKVLSKWTSIKNPLHEVSIENPGYKQRVCSIKVGFAEHDTYLKEEYEQVNKRNQLMGLTPEGSRIITLHEAKYIAKSGLLEMLNSMYEIDGETHVFSHVPSDIRINDVESLCKHITETIESLPNVKKKGPKIEEITDEEPKEGPTLK